MKNKKSRGAESGSNRGLEQNTTDEGRKRGASKN